MPQKLNNYSPSYKIHLQNEIKSKYPVLCLLNQIFFLLFIYLPMVPKYEVFILFNNKILYKYHATDVFPFVPVTAIVLFGNFE